MIKHIAFIMDGNGRYAKNLNRERSYGHEVGFDNMVTIINHIALKKIPYGSFYGFSTENWNRPTSEVQKLMNVPMNIYNNHIDELNESNVIVNFIGLRNRVPEDTLSYINLIENSTKNNSGSKIFICFDYGTKQELVDSVNALIEKGVKKVCYEDIRDNLYTKNAPDIDLLVRTSGEYRLSNFMLLQASYAELFFPKTYWPEFSIEEFDEILEKYEKRDRRFGKIEVIK